MIDSGFKMTLHDTIPFLFNTKFHACKDILINALKNEGYDEAKNQNDELSLSEVSYRKNQIRYLFINYDEYYYYDLNLWVFLNEKENIIRLGVVYTVTTIEDNVRVINEYYAINVNHDYDVQVGIFNENEIDKVEDFKEKCDLLIKKYKERSLK